MLNREYELYNKMVKYSMHNASSTLGENVGYYRHHIGYQYALFEDFDTKCRRAAYWYLVHIISLI